MLAGRASARRPVLGLGSSRGLGCRIERRRWGQDPLSRLKSASAGAETQGVPTFPAVLGASLTSDRARLSRRHDLAPRHLGLVCASLYAAALGARRGRPGRRPAEPTPAAETAHAPPATPSRTATATPSPFPSPVETVVDATPTPAQTPTPAPDATATPDEDAHPDAHGHAHARRRRARPRATPAPAPRPTATPGADGSAAREHRRPDRAQGVAGIASGATGELVGTVVAATSRPQPLVETARGQARGAGDKVTTTRHGHPRRRHPRPDLPPDGTPTPANPSYSLATPGPAPIGVPNFFIDKFRIPPFLLPIYQAAGIQYGVRWEVLAAINEIETDYGRNLNVSSAGALGWMQFMPATWKMYGVDANGDGQKDPFNPVDAIFAAARYLRAAGADQDLYRAIFAYNHADWYVESVLMRARVIGGLPVRPRRLAHGPDPGPLPRRAPRPPTPARCPTSERAKRFEPGQNAANVVESDGTRRSIRHLQPQGRARRSPSRTAASRASATRASSAASSSSRTATATPTATRASASSPTTYPFPQRAQGEEARARAARGRSRAQARRLRDDEARRATRRGTRVAHGRPAAARQAAPARRRRHAAAPPLPAKERLFANPTGRTPAPPAATTSSRVAQPRADGRSTAAGSTRRTSSPSRSRRARASAAAPCSAGSAARRTIAPHMRFEIRPAGRGAPRIDPKPILDGWKLLESTAIYRSAKRNPFFGEDAETPSIGQIMLMSKEALQRHVLTNPQHRHLRVRPPRHRAPARSTAACSRRSSSSPPRASSRPSARCAAATAPTRPRATCPSTPPAPPSTSPRSTASSITPATQGKGSITDLTIQRLLTLQGTMKPHQIISLMTFEGTDNTFAMGDHDDHIHVGFRPLYGANSKAARRMAAVLKPDQWIKLIDRISEIDNPAVREQPSNSPSPSTKRAS